MTTPNIHMTQPSPPLYHLIPVKCFTCGHPVASLYQYYRKTVQHRRQTSEEGVKAAALLKKRRKQQQHIDTDDNLHLSDDDDEEDTKKEDDDKLPDFKTCLSEQSIEGIVMTELGLNMCCRTLFATTIANI